MTAKLTAASQKLFDRIASDHFDPACGWQGVSPLPHIGKNEKGNLTDLKVKDLILTYVEDGTPWVEFTPAGKALYQQRCANPESVEGTAPPVSIECWIVSWTWPEGSVQGGRPHGPYFEAHSREDTAYIVCRDLTNRGAVARFDRFTCELSPGFLEGDAEPADPDGEIPDEARLYPY